MSWKDKDWDSLTFYNNDGETLKKAKEDFLTYDLYKGKKTYYESYNKLVLDRYDKNIYPLDCYEESKETLQAIANKYNVCIKYTFLGTCCIDIKPMKQVYYFKISNKIKNISKSYIFSDSYSLEDLYRNISFQIWFVFYNNHIEPYSEYFIHYWKTYDFESKIKNEIESWHDDLGFSFYYKKLDLYAPSENPKYLYIIIQNDKKLFLALNGDNLSDNIMLNFKAVVREFFKDKNEEDFEEYWKKSGFETMNEQIIDTNGNYWYITHVKIDKKY